MDERTTRVSDLLHEAGEVHHVVYRITDGADDDWASFYADWLTRLSELGDVLGTPPVRSHLVHELGGVRAGGSGRAVGGLVRRADSRPVRLAPSRPFVTVGRGSGAGRCNRSFSFVP
jgi:hypothetical protein